MSAGNARDAPRRIVVIGAGVVGVCTALSLQRDGHAVTVIDREPPGQSCSYGNAAVINEVSVVPEATPGVIKAIPRMLADPVSPVAVRWSYLPRLAPWLLRFLAAARPKEVKRISEALAGLLGGAIDAFTPWLTAAGEPGLIERTGWLCVYESKRGFQAYQPMLELQRRLGVRFEVLEPGELYEREPNLARRFHGAVHYPDAARALQNFRLVQVLAELVTRQGGTIVRREVRGFDVGADGVRSVRTYGEELACDAVVIAGGAWSGELTRKLGTALPLDTERGYHVHMPDPGVMPNTPLYSVECAFACTPLEDGLRAAGTVELGGLKAKPDWRRAEALRRHVKRWLPAVNESGYSRWMGFRPSMPDSLPVISPAPRVANAFFAFGHGHCGLMMAARTGNLVADLVAGRPSDIDLTPFRADRF